MKKLICILLCLCVLLPFASCKRNETEEKECYLSSSNMIWGNRIYRIQKAKNITGNNQTYLVYSKAGENGKDIRIGCVDPLCTHDRNTCTAHCVGGEELLFVPEEKAPKIYFFYRTVSQTTDLDRVSQIGKGGFESYDIDTGAGFFFDNPYCEYGTVTTK